MPRNVFSCGVLYRTVLVCFLLTSLCAAADHWKSWEYEESRDETRDFVSGGSIYVRNRVGDISIRPSGSNQIRVRYTVKSHRERAVKDARLNFDVHGSSANLDFQTSGEGIQVDVELEIPQNSSLDVREKVGDISIDRILGDKDLDLSVGDIRVVADESYRFVDASSSIGNVNSDVKGAGREESGFLGKTFKFHGDGKYELRAHVSVGDVTIEEGK